MARRRREEDLADVLVALPWQVSACLAFGGYVAMSWLLPSLFAHNPFLVGLASVSRSLAWLSLAGFGFLSVVAYIRGRTASEARPTRPSHAFGNRVAQKADATPSRVEPTIRQSISGFGNSEPVLKEFSTWSLEALRAMEWKRFELLCAGYYEAKGFQSKTLRCGADGGIDVKLFRVDPDKPIAVVQCKAWNVYSVGVKEIRELLGVMAHEKVDRGVFITTATYTQDALSFGAANPIHLIDGAAFVTKLRDLSPQHQDALLEMALQGDYKTPTCPSCGIKMIKRDGKRGPFFGCENFPRCKTTSKIKLER
jgi:restriction system protein